MHGNDRHAANGVIIRLLTDVKLRAKVEPVHKGFAYMLHDNGNAEFPYVPVAIRRIAEKSRECRICDEKRTFSCRPKLWQDACAVSESGSMQQMK
jgi:hypothetical protein